MHKELKTSTKVGTHLLAEANLPEGMGMEAFVEHLRLLGHEIHEINESRGTVAIQSTQLDTLVSMWVCDGCHRFASTDKQKVEGHEADCGGSGT